MVSFLTNVILISDKVTVIWKGESVQGIYLAACKCIANIVSHKLSLEHLLLIFCFNVSCSEKQTNFDTNYGNEIKRSRSDEAEKQNARVCCRKITIRARATSDTPSGRHNYHSRRGKRHWKYSKKWCLHSYFEITESSLFSGSCAFSKCIIFSGTQLFRTIVTVIASCDQQFVGGTVVIAASFNRQFTAAVSYCQLFNSNWKRSVWSLPNKPCWSCYSVESQSSGKWY